MLAESNFDTREIMASERFFYQKGLRTQRTSEPRRDGGTERREGKHWNTAVGHYQQLLPMSTRIMLSNANIFQVKMLHSCYFSAVAFNSDPKGDMHAGDSTSPDTVEKKEET